MSERSVHAIGGYLQLEAPGGRGLTWMDEAAAFQSGRSAMAATLRAARPRAVWAPHHVCGVVNDMLECLGIPVHRFRLAEDRGIPPEVQPGPSEWVLCVDYFGLGAPVVAETLARFGVERVLVDASQSLYYHPPAGGTAVYSPRKFVGVPDGGLARTPLSLEKPGAADEAASRARCQHLESRAAGRVEAGYTQFQAAEASLMGCEPRGMSDLTRAMLNTIDFERVASRRIANYRTLEAALAARGMEVIALEEGMVPLCCPLMRVDAPALRQKLQARRIYSPVYWMDAAIPSQDSVAMMLRDNTLYLPCDQRYTSDDMRTIIHALFD